MPTPPTILSIVLCPTGQYQATCEYQKPVNCYPHYVTARKVVIGKTIEDAISKIRSVCNEQQQGSRVD